MEGTIQQIWWKQLEQLRIFLYGAFFFFMPFTQALTFNIGFPLKLSELALFLLSFVYLICNRRVLLPRTITLLVSALVFIVSLSVFIALLRDYDYPLKEYITRFGYKGDSIARYVYFLLAVFSFVISVDIFLENTMKFIRIWVGGAIVAALYSWYLVLFSSLHLPVYLLPGMQHPPQTIFGGIIRCGTFLEGNMMGLYLLISGGLAFYIRKYRSGLFLLISVFTTFSTLAIIGVIFFLFSYFKSIFLTQKYLPYFITGILIAVPLLIYFTHTNFYEQNIRKKIFSSTTEINSEAAYSKADRFMLIKTAYIMGMDHPALGVGLSNYGRHYDHYFNSLPMRQDMRVAFARKNAKPIPNNIYLEVWAESGLFALILFCSFLICLLFYTRSDKTRVLLPVLLVMLFCFNAYPSFIMIYLWAFMALPVAGYIKAGDHSINR
jgi:hypothetical protein